MCGIVGYVGKRNAQELIYKGLARLEYRGYDSSGIAALQKSGNSFETKVIKAPGKLKELKAFWKDIDFASEQAMGHTRWATHGEANQVNAHPHRSGPITIVHNGIIENHQEIRAALVKAGSKLLSETDSELFSHMVRAEREAGKTLLEAVRVSFQKIHGASAFVVMDDRLPGEIVVVRNGSPLVLGLGKGENFVASDVPAVLESTKTIYYLEDNELAELKQSGVRVFTLDGKEKNFQTVEIQWALDSIDKQGYPHYMLKEIFEQPRALSDTLSSWLELSSGKFRLDAAAISRKNNSDKKVFSHEEMVSILANAPMLQIVACGTAAHAGFFGAYLLESIAKVPVRAELASEFRYREPVLQADHVGLVVSQSGETADTLAAVKQMKAAGMKVFAICNVRDSSIPRECDAVFYTNAGIEVGVASTKAFTTQMAVFMVLTGAISSFKKTITAEQENTWVKDLGHLSEVARKFLDKADEIKAVAKKYSDKKGFLFLGRGFNFPIALEGALKLKEIAYVHAEGYPAGELKHGPIAMVEPSMLVIAIAPEAGGLRYSKSLSNIEEVKARKGTLFSIVGEKDQDLRKISDSVITVPTVSDEKLLPIFAVMALQLFSYYVALEKGTEVDQPRNLAKSVTVE